MKIQASLRTDKTRIDASLHTNVSANGEFLLGHALMWDSHGRLAVKVANAAEKDNTLPITAAAVHTEIGNIEVLLSTI